MLINTMAELAEYVEVNSGASWAALKPSIKVAERKFIVPAIGAGLYSELNTAYNTAPQTLSAKQSALLALMQEAIAQFTIYLFIPRAEVQVTDGGLQRQVTETAKSAYKYQVIQLRDSLLDAGYENIEQVLEYLESNVADFDSWANSDARTDANALLIRSGRELKKYYSHLRQPQRTYGDMMSILRAIEDFTIAEAAGDDYPALKAKLLDGTASAQEAELIDLLKKALAYMAIAKAAADLSVRIDGSGITIVGQRPDGTLGEDSNRAGADAGRVDALADTCQNTALQYLHKAGAFMDKNATALLFPARFAALQAIADTSAPLDINPTLNGCFGL